MENTGLAYYLGLVDEAERSIVHDALSEDKEKKSYHVEMPEPVAVSLSPLAQLEEYIYSCHDCESWKVRSRTLFGSGASHPLFVFLGDGPGAEDEQASSSFSGKNARALDDWIRALVVDKRTECYFTTLVKCRRAKGVKEFPCMAKTKEQIALLTPRVVVVLGEYTARNYLGTDADITALRGHVHAFNGLSVVVTYHPRDVWKDAGLKRAVWDDLRLAADVAGVTARRAKAHA